MTDIKWTPFKEYKIQYKGIDTVQGIEIEYYYFVKDKSDKCNKSTFFTIDASILTFNNITSAFSHCLFTIQDYYEGSTYPEPFSTNYQTDTFYVNNIYINTQNNLDKYYKISTTEYIRISKVKAIVDIFSGNEESFKYFNPLTNFPSTNKEWIIALRYHYVLERRFIFPDTVYGTTAKSYSSFFPCKLIVE